ncbi:MAG: hypothetical protein NDF55_09140 [archaeon GB-1867-005]|nr:hypothetical protein [Candidatus Culexmicrobium cathedralense]
MISKQSPPPLSKRKIRRKFYGMRLNPTVYKAFQLLCRKYGYKRVNRVIEKIMLRCVLNETFLLLILEKSIKAEAESQHSK